MSANNESTHNMTREEMKLRIRNLESRIDHWKAVADSRWKMILALTGRSSETLEDVLQAQQEGWRWAQECEEEVKRLKECLFAMQNAAIELAKQEPVEYQIKILGERWTHCAKHLYDPNNPATRALYTAPPKREWVGLTDESIHAWWARENGLEDCDMCVYEHFTKVVRAIEAALKDKNA